MRETWWLLTVPVYQTGSLTSTLLQFGHTLIFSVDFCFERKAGEKRSACLLGGLYTCCCSLEKETACVLFKADALFLICSPFGTCLPYARGLSHFGEKKKKFLNLFFLSQTDVRRVEAEVSVAPVTTLSD